MTQLGVAGTEADRPLAAMTSVAMRGAGAVGARRCVLYSSLKVNRLDPELYCIDLPHLGDALLVPRGVSYH